MKIKILSHIGEYYDEHDSHILKGCTDWEEVDTDTYHKLAGWCAIKNRELNDVRYTIFTDEQLDLHNCVQDYLEQIAAEESRRAEIKRIRDEKRRVRLAAKQKLAEDQERKLLDDLKKKYES